MLLFLNCQKNNLLIILSNDNFHLFKYFLRTQLYIQIMESLEEKIKPFIEPLLSRIEALEAENKQLKATVEDLKSTKPPPKQTLPENRLNRTQTEVGPNKNVKIITPKVVAPVQPKQPAVIKKNPKPGVTDDPVVQVNPTKSGDKSLGTDKSRPTLKAADKEPATEKKDTTTKDLKAVTHPRAPLKGKEPQPAASTPAVKKDPKDIKQTPKPVDNKTPKVIAGGKQPKVETPTTQTVLEKQPVEEKTEIQTETEKTEKIESQPQNNVPKTQSVETQQIKKDELPAVQPETAESKKDELLAQESAANVADQEHKEQEPQPAAEQPHQEPPQVKQESHILDLASQDSIL